jgi:hypothetical protein
VPPGFAPGSEGPRWFRRAWQLALGFIVLYIVGMCIYAWLTGTKL